MLPDLFPATPTKTKMTKREKIKILLKATQDAHEIETGFKELIDSLPDDLLPGLHEIKKKFVARFDEIYASAIEAQIDLYDKLISEPAIDASVAFYASPEGQELIKAIPAVNKGLSDSLFNMNTKIAQEMLQELLQLDLPDDVMSGMGFVKMNPGEFPEGLFGSGFGNMFKKQQEETEIPKPQSDVNPANPGEVTPKDFERFFNEFLKPKE